MLSVAEHEPQEEITNVDDLLELKSMLHETVKEWPKQWMAEGLEKGREEGRLIGRREGERDIVSRLLTRKFGPLDDDARARLDRADLETLQRWSDRLLDASALEEVWGE